MTKWEAKYQLIRAGRWIGKRLVTLAVVAGILLVVALAAWLIQFLNANLGVDSTIFSFAVLVVCVWFVLLDHAIWD